LLALGKVARQLEELHGDWRKPWGEMHRLQRTAYRADTMEAAVSLLSFTASQPCAAAPGPLGVVLTIDSTPSVALIRPPRFAVVGCSYMSAILCMPAAILCMPVAPLARTQAERPNVLFCISDDQSYAHTGANGDKVVQTPALDRVADEGIRFTYDVCDAPTCGPSRTAILTGQHI
jgi:hypothetical protein